LNFVIDRDAVNYRQNWLASALFTVFTQVLNAIYTHAPIRACNVTLRLIIRKYQCKL
jgi:hypothetical protein